MQYLPEVKTTAIHANDAHRKVIAYRELFNVTNSEVITFVRGVFYDAQHNYCFLNNRALVTVTEQSIKWFDSDCQEETTITPADDNFELLIRV